MHKELADGLILRSLSEGHASDRARLPDFYAAVNGEDDPPHIQEGLRVWTRGLMAGHPTVTPDDIFVVVDPAHDDLIVSATLLIPQTWRYAGIACPAGRPELVGTLPAYRGRGLVRALFDVVHARSATLGHMLQGITGIPYFYRQFGYTMAVELGDHAVYHLRALADPAPDYKPAYTLRPAAADDIPALLGWFNAYGATRLLSDFWTPATMTQEIMGRPAEHMLHLTVLVIEDAQGQGVGALGLSDLLLNPYELRCPAYVVGDQASYLGTFNDVMQGLKVWATAHYGRCPEMLYFGTGIHPTLDTLIDRSFAGLVRQREYAWYLRVPEPMRFLQQIAPVLEQRLEGSGAHRYTGALRIGFFDLTGICLTFAQGRLAGIEPLRGKDGYDVQFPWRLFWNVVFGYRTADEILHVLPEAWGNAQATALLEILFPKQQSFLLGLT